MDALRAVRVNLAFELLGALGLAVTLCTEPLQWRDLWDGLDLLLALPTLFILRAYHADPPPRLARWCWALLVAYALGVAVDVWWLFAGRWKQVPSRSLTALGDAGALCMWAQCVYYNRQLALVLARQAPIAYVTVSTHTHAASGTPLSRVDARATVPVPVE